MEVVTITFIVLLSHDTLFLQNGSFHFRYCAARSTTSYSTSSAAGEKVKFNSLVLWNQFILN